MPDGQNSQGWTDPVWQGQAHAWIRTTLEQQGTPVIGEIEQPYLRPWSTVMHVPTSQGRVYFKACDPHSSYEPALTQALHQWRPDCMVRVLAVNLEQAWMLMADEGEMLRLRVNGPQDLWHWEHLMPVFARVQIEMIERRDELLRLGVFDRRLERLPAMFTQLLADREVMRIGREDGLSEAQYARLQNFAPQYADMCRRLAGYPIPDSLHHDDFHNSNVFVCDERYAFSDWGESCLSHPFFSIIITLRNIADRLGLPDEVGITPESLTPGLNHLRDLYLEPWTRFAPSSVLQEVFPLAWRVGMVNRAISWYQSLKLLDAPTREEYAYTVPAWLGEFLQTV